MAVLIADNMLALMRYEMQDTDSVDGGLLDAQCYMELNNAYHDFLAAYPDLLVANAGTLNMAIGNYSYTFTANGDFRDLTAATKNNGLALERCNIEEALGILNTMTTSSNIRSWAARRSNTDHTKWTILVLPTPVGAAGSDILTFYGHLEPVDLAAGVTPMVGSAESRWIAKIAAARGAAKMGRTQEFIDAIWRDIPQNIQNEMRVVEGAKRPYVTQNEQVT